MNVTFDCLKHARWLREGLIYGTTLGSGDSLRGGKKGHEWNPEWEFVLRAVIDCKKIATAYLLPSAQARSQAIMPEPRHFVRSERSEIGDSCQCGYLAAALLKAVRKELSAYAYDEFYRAIMPLKQVPIPAYFINELLEELDHMRSILWARRHNAGFEGIKGSGAMGMAYESDAPAYMECPR